MQLWFSLALFSATLPATFAVRVHVRHELGAYQDLDQPASQWDYRDNGASWTLGQCGAGAGQSPLDLSTAVQVAATDVLLHSYVVLQNPLSMHNDGHSLVVNLPKGMGSLSLGADTWDAHQLVIHVPSEHMYGGQRAALELQIYHAKAGSNSFPGQDQQPAADATAVAAIGFVATTQASPLLDSLRQGGLPSQSGGTKLVNRQAPAQLDLGSLFVGSSFLHYQGSLTTPPCSSGVDWFVRTAALPASQAALEEFRTVIVSMASLQQSVLGNVRALQPMPSGFKVSLLSTQAVSHPGLPAGQTAGDPEFDKAVGEAAGEQAKFENSLPADGHLTQEEVQRLRCAREYAAAQTSLKTAEAQQKVECDGLKEAKEQLERAGEGVTRLQALDRVRAEEQLCSDSTKVVARLQQETETLGKQCKQMEER